MEQVDSENGKSEAVAGIDSLGQGDADQVANGQVGANEGGGDTSGLGINGGGENNRGGDNRGLTPPALQRSQESARQEDDGTAYPGDHALDDPALLETPARSQRQVDLEAFDLHLQGFSVRQIAKRQKVHPNTAFNRIKRGRQIEEREAVRAQGESLHVLASKLRQIEGAFFDQARQGDYRSATLVLRIMERLRKLDDMATQLKEAAVRNAPAPAHLPAAPGAPDPLRHCGPAARPAPLPFLQRDRRSDEDAEANVFKDFALFTEFLTEMLPHRATDLEAMKGELRQAVAADLAEDRANENARRQDAGVAESPASLEPSSAEPGVPPQRHYSAVPQAVDHEARDQPSQTARPAEAIRPLNRRERKRQKWAQRQQEKEAARAQRVQSANSGASARANTKPAIPAENGESAAKRFGRGILSALGAGK